MRHPIENLPDYIDPWAFARARRIEHGFIPLSTTHELKQWASNQQQKLEAEIEGYTDDDQQLHLAGFVQVSLSVECQRCLQPLLLEIEHEYDYVIIRDQAYEQQVEGGFETIICNDQLDLAWFLEEEVLLAMPMVARHEHCDAPLMVDIDEATEEEERQYPFAGLKEIMKAKEH